MSQDDPGRIPDHRESPADAGEDSATGAATGSAAGSATGTDPAAMGDATSRETGTAPQEAPPPVPPDDGARDHAAHQREVRDALARVEKLIMYDAQSEGLAPAESRAYVLDFASKVRSGASWSPAEESDFWAHTSNIAAKLPFTYESLESSRTRARWYVWVFGLVTTLLLALLLYSQFTWVVLNNVTRTIDQTRETLASATIARDAAQFQMEQAETAAGAATAAAQGSDLSTENAYAAAKKRHAEAQQKIDDARTQLRSSARILQSWVPLQQWLDVSKPPEPGLFAGEDEEKEYQRRLEQWRERQADENTFRDETLATWADQILQGMSAYFLPMIYGLVGACAFVLRRLSSEIRQLTFSESSTVQYLLRIVLGALAGISVGWFFKPEPSQELITSISPLALAFVAGYSVELVFTAMDRIISAFSSERERDPQRPPGRAG